MFSHSSLNVQVLSLDVVAANIRIHQVLSLCTLEEGCPAHTWKGSYTRELSWHLVAPCSPVQSVTSQEQCQTQKAALDHGRDLDTGVFLYSKHFTHSKL